MTTADTTSGGASATIPIEAMSGGASGVSVSPSEVTERLVSVDVLRGFDMFWIVGAEDIVHALDKAGAAQGAESGEHAGGLIGLLSTQLSHVEWRGFHFYDLIFPLFVFLAGVAAVFSLDKALAKDGKTKAYTRLTKRFVLLYAVGLLYYGGFSRQFRFVGVLQRIAMSYFFASLLYINLRLRGLIIACAAILIGYWALFTFVPVPADPDLQAINPAWGQGGISVEPGNNWANWVDFHFLPGRRWDGQWDPEGLLSSFPAVATALLGIFAGMLLKNKNVPEMKKVFYLLAAGAAGVVLGYLWGLQFPVIKKIWSSSYVLVAGGYSSILLGLFYLVVDIWKVRWWTAPFVWIGSNALTAYLLARFVDFGEIAQIFVGGPVKEKAGAYGDLIGALAGMLLLILVVRFLYRRRVFIRL